jgi:hypothetical protein
MVDFLTDLRRRDSLLDASSGWRDCVALTETYFTALDEIEYLQNRASPLQANRNSLSTLSTLELSIFSLSELLHGSGRLLQSLHDSVADLEAEASQLLTLRTAAAPEHATLSATVASAAADVASEREVLSTWHEFFSDLSQQDAQLTSQEDSLQHKLSNLSNREHILRNRSSLFTHVIPVVNVARVPDEVPDAVPYRCRSDSMPPPPLFGSPEHKIHRNAVSCVAFCPGMPLLASGGEDYFVNLIQTDTYRPVGQIRSTTKTVMAVDFSLSGQLLLFASWDKAVVVHRATAAHPQICNLRDHTDCVYDARFISDDRIVSCSRDHTIRLFDVRRAMQVSSFATTSRPLSLCSVQGGSMVLTSHFDGSLRGWDFRQRGVVLEFKTHPARVAFVAGVPMTSHVVSFGMDDKTIVLSDLMMKTVVAKVVNRAVVSREKVQLGLWNDLVMVGGMTGELYCYDSGTLKLRNNVKGNGSPIYCVGAKISGEVATGDQAGFVKFWTL